MSVIINGVSPGSYVSPITTPSPGAPVVANDVQIVAQVIGNQTAWLEAGKAALAGATFTGPVVVNAKATLNGTGANATIIVDASSIGVDSLQVDDLLYKAGRSRRRARVTLADSTPLTIDVSQGDAFVLPVNPSGTPNVIILRTTTAPVPLTGETIDLIMPNQPGGAPGIRRLYEIKRESGTDIVWFQGGTDTNVPITAQFEFDGTNWRLGLCSGGSFDSVGSYVGVTSINP
jgi:hypothetical protein